MKIVANAGELAGALALAASLSSNRVRKVLDFVHLVAVDELTATANVTDFALTLAVPAQIMAAGEIAVPASRLAALAAGFDAKAPLLISVGSGETTASIGCGRSRFKLPALALQELPAPLVLSEEIGSVVLAREEAAALLMRPAFAVSTEPTRSYIGGVLLHDHEGGLAGVATDGKRLVRLRVPNSTGLSADYTLIVPGAALKTIGKLLVDKSNERITLRRSKTLISIEAARFVFLSKLVDGVFPDYMRAVPPTPGNTVICDRAELLRALGRVAAVAEPGKPRVAVLSWSEEEPALRLSLGGSDGADDAVEAEAAGHCRTAAQIHLLVEMLDELGGRRVCIASDGGASPFLVSNIDREDFLGLQMPCDTERATRAA